jgi:hypothetical protein
MAGRQRTGRRPLVSVIVVNLNVCEFLRSALTSLQRSLVGIPSEILVVDNASVDNSLQMLRVEFPTIKVIENTNNVGFAKANNQALARARGTYLLLINPDTLVQERTVRSMLKFFEAHADAGIAGCKILNPDGSFQLSCRRSFPSPWVAFTKIVGLSALFPHSRWFGRYNLTYLDEQETYEVDVLSGSFMMLRRTVYEEVGGLDESYFLYGEDIDWCARIKRAGWKIFYSHETSIIHYKGESTRRSDVDQVKLFYEAMDIFIRNYFSNPLIFRLVMRLGIFLSRLAAALTSASRRIP